MSTNLSLRDLLLSKIPTLRAFAFALCGKSDQADDLVQDTLLRAWAHLDRFQAGTNMEAWLVTILRNEFRSSWRKRRRIVEDVDGKYSARLACPGEQDGHLAFEDLRHALAKLPLEQREAVILVGASGMSVEKAAEVCGCEPGTIKSRVSRGRARLSELLSGQTQPRRAHARTMCAAA